MNVQYTTAATRNFQSAAARHMNVDTGTYRAGEREQGRGYGRSVGYAAPRPYASQSSSGSLFRVR